MQKIEIISAAAFAGAVRHGTVLVLPGLAALTLASLTALSSAMVARIS